MKNPPVITSEYAEKLWDEPHIVFENPVVSVETSAFKKNHNLKKLEFKEEVEQIKTFTFFGCDNLKELVFDKKCLRLNELSFSMCKSLNVFSFEQIDFIGINAFSYCNIENLDFNRIEHIGKFAFLANNLKSVLINKLVEIEAHAFDSNSIRNITIDIPAGKMESIFLYANAFVSNKIDNIFYSAPDVNIDAFSNTNIKNFFINLNPVKAFYFTSFNEFKPVIENIFINGALKSALPFQCYYDEFLNNYKTKTRQAKIDDILDMGLTFKEANDLFKKSNKPEPYI